MTALSKELSRRRKLKKLSQAQVADYMCEHGFPLTQKGVSKWECGDTLPNAEQFLQLCRLYQVRDVLSVFFNEKTEADGLNEDGRQRLEEYAGLLLQSERFRAAEDKGFPLYDLDTLTDNAVNKAEKLEANIDIPANADFCVRLCDDSMAPLFEKGQILFVQKKRSLNSGEFGLFFYRGKALCRLFMPGEHIELVSANVHCPPIRIKNEKDLSIIGGILTLGDKV